MKSSTRGALIAATLAVVTAGVFTTAASREPQPGGETANGDTPVVAAEQNAPATVDTQQVVIKVSGMYCAGCETTVRTMLTRSPGVISAEVSVDRGVASVVYDSTRTTPAKLMDVINRLGYRATLSRA